jgi:hypothetical protein
MLALVIVLVVTNVVTVAALVVVLRTRLGAESPADPALADAMPPARGMAATPAARGRRVISIEIHNPIELAGHRNRMFGIAGSFVPDLTRRVVYDQTARLLRDGLAAQRVVADVRVHAFGAGTSATAITDSSPLPSTSSELASNAPAPVAGLAAEFADEAEPDRLAD